MTMVDTKKSFADSSDPSSSVADRETQPAYSATDPVLEAVVVDPPSGSHQQDSDPASIVTPALAPAPPGAVPIQAAAAPPPPPQHQAYQHESAPLLVGGLPRYNSVSTPTRRALARFLEAFAYAAFFFLLISIVTSGEIRRHIHKGHRQHGDWNWDDDDGWWWFSLSSSSPSAAPAS